MEADELLDLAVSMQWGTDVLKEIAAEVLLAATTPKGSMLGSREYGTGINDARSEPTGPVRNMVLAMEAVHSIQYYNDHVLSSEERRVAVIYDEIEIDTVNSAQGELSITVPYIPVRAL